MKVIKSTFVVRFESGVTLAQFYIAAADIYYDKDVLDVAIDYYQN